MKTSVILPTYNEKGNIVSLVQDIRKNLLKAKIAYEIIIVDDNSPDNTANICRKAFNKDKNVKIFVRKTDRGLASAIYFGIKKARGDYLLVMDTDYSHDPALIPQMVIGLNTFDMVTGSRYIKGGGMENTTRYWLSRLYNIYLQVLFGIRLTDFLSGFFSVRKTYLMDLTKRYGNIFYGYGEYFIRLIFLVRGRGGQIVELPSFYKERFYGKSKTRFFSIFITYTKTSLELVRQKNI